MSTITKREYYQKIENSLLEAMSKIDESVYLMNRLYHENHKEADEVLSAKKILKKVLNAKFDESAIKRNS